MAKKEKLKSFGQLDLSDFAAIPEQDEQKAAPAAAACVPKTAAEAAAEPGRSVLQTYKLQQYAPTHRLCTLMGYLIGAPAAQFFDAGHSFLEKAEYDRLDKLRELRAIRALCRLRCHVLQNCNAFFAAFSDNTRLIGELLPAELQSECTRYGYSIYPAKRDVYEYLIQLNGEVNRALDRGYRIFCRQLPENVNPKYLRSLLLFPGGTTAKNVSAVSLFFSMNRNRYPWRCYINLGEDLPEYMVLSGDDYLLENAYRLAGDKADMLWQFRTPYDLPDAKEQLHRFLRPEGNYSFHLLIDGISMTVEQILAVLQEIQPREYRYIEKIYLFCCSDTFKNWKYFFGEYAAKIHAVEVKSPVIDDGRLEDIAANMCACLFGAPANIAYVLFTANAKIFADVSGDIISSRHSMCLITRRDAPDSILDFVSSQKRPYCFAEEFDVQLPAERQKYAQQMVQKKFPLVLRENLRRLVENTLLEIPTGFTAAEREELYRQLLQEIHLSVKEDGSMHIEL